MSTTNPQEMASPTSQTTTPPASDGKAPLPSALPEYPTPGSTDPGDSGSTTGK